MKEGFYLSPDGLHIVELSKKIWFENVFNVFGLAYGYEDTFFFDGLDYELEIIFSSWEILE